MAPATTMTTANTEAKTGRSMKKWDTFILPGSFPACCWHRADVPHHHGPGHIAFVRLSLTAALRRGAGRCWPETCVVLGDHLRLGIDLGDGPHPLHPVHHHPFPRRQPVANHAQTIDERTQGHLAVFHGVLVIDHEGEALRL